MIATALEQSEVERLLERTSRTFALAIPLLPPSLARPVSLAYLLFRVADELEDAPLWRRDRRRDALGAFVRWLDATADGASDVAWSSVAKAEPPTRHEGCLELLSRADDLLVAIRALDAPVATAIVTHARRTALGMAEFVARQDDAGALTLGDLDELRRYAYVVAGIVGELLTELFAHEHAGIRAARPELDADASAFGEGLQLVNILKDAPVDAREGRSYIPRDVKRADVVELARGDLVRAQRYVTTLESAGAPPGTIAFCDLPVRLAVATLDRLEMGAPKLERTAVMGIYAEVTKGLARA